MHDPEKWKVFIFNKLVVLYLSIVSCHFGEVIGKATAAEGGPGEAKTKRKYRV